MIDIPENKDFVPEKPKKVKTYADCIEEIVGYLAKPEVKGIGVYKEDPYDKNIPSGFDEKTGIAYVSMDRHFITMMINDFKNKHYYVYEVRIGLVYGFYLISRTKREGENIEPM